MTATATTGTLVRVLKTGQAVTVEDFVSAEESEDGIPFYWASSDHGMNDVILFDGDFEVKLTAAQARARRPPSPEQVVRALSFIGDHGTFDCDETEPDGASLLCFGRTPDGLRIAVELTVTNVYEVDF